MQAAVKPGRALLTCHVCPLFVPACCQQIEEAIERTMEQTTVRVYGGFVLVAGGDVGELGCPSMGSGWQGG